MVLKKDGDTGRTLKKTWLTLDCCCSLLSVCTCATDAGGGAACASAALENERLLLYNTR